MKRILTLTLILSFAVVGNAVESVWLGLDPGARMGNLQVEYSYSKFNPQTLQQQTITKKKTYTSSGFGGGLIATLDFSPKFGLDIGAGYYQNNYVLKDFKTDFESTGQIDMGPLMGIWGYTTTLKDDYKVDFTNIKVDLLGRYNFSPDSKVSPWVAFGPSILMSTAKHIMPQMNFELKVVTGGAFMPTGTIISSETVKSVERTESKTNIAAAVGLGVNIALSETVALCPSIKYEYTVSGWEGSAIYGQVAFKVKL